MKSCCRKICKNFHGKLSKNECFFVNLLQFSYRIIDFDNIIQGWGQETYEKKFAIFWIWNTSVIVSNEREQLRSYTFQIIWNGFGQVTAWNAIFWFRKSLETTKNRTSVNRPAYDLRHTIFLRFLILRLTTYDWQCAQGLIIVIKCYVR